MTSQLNVAVLIGSATDPDHVLTSTLGDEPLDVALSRAAGRDVHAVLISWLPSKTHPEGYPVAPNRQRINLADRALKTLGVQRLYDVLQRFPAGRLVNSLGPLDPSRVFWRAIRADGGARAAIQSCEVLIAVDLAAVRTAWELRRSSDINATEAYYGLGSTLKVFNSRYFDTTSS